MTVTTALSVTRASQVGTDLVNAWTAEGLPAPTSISAQLSFNLVAGEHEAVSLAFYGPDCFEDLNRWARALEVDTVGKLVGETEFLDAERLHRGVVVRLVSNRPVAE